MALEDWPELELALPPSPLCERCSHQLCACCPVPWCDRLLDGEDLSSCCDGDCCVDAFDFESWQRQVSAVRREHGDFAEVEGQQLGPPRPYTLERARGMLLDQFLSGALYGMADRAAVKAVAAAADLQGQEGAEGKCKPENGP